jgi:putative nucleotidyltransferase with HDIG domain
MEDEQKTKEQLISDLKVMRSKISELEKSHGKLMQAEKALSQSLVKLKSATGFIINILAVAVEVKDPYIAGHQKRVTDLARAIAAQMNLPADVISGIHMAGLIHDIGKISVPVEIIEKSGSLSDDEYSVVKNHPEMGHQILKDIDFGRPVALIVYQHHERMNGTGYPQGLKGEEIILEARILAIADVVEAICTHRPYRKALGIERALKEISDHRGVLYDREAVGACLTLFRERGFSFKPGGNR